ncbi:MAG: transaldolase [Nitrospirae bacterium]|nr:transaldolase [Nitrospirota bacterium]
MRPQSLRSKIFLDGGDAGETRDITAILGFLDGQTTNPTLISKNPQAKERLERGGKFTEKEIFDFYRGVVKDIYELIPQGSISIEVYADPSTEADKMLAMGRDMFSWIPKAQVKLPTSKEGLKAAEQAVKEGLRINMTLCFSQEQAAAVYAATRGAKKGQVYVSPFIGRLDDRGEKGMDVIAHIIKMYRKGDGHVEVLTASVRNMDHLLCALKLGSDIITAPYAILKEWGRQGMPFPDNSYTYKPAGLEDIPYKEIDLSKNWREYDIAHDLTVKGMEKFSKDWNDLIAQPLAAR